MLEFHRQFDEAINQVKQGALLDGQRMFIKLVNKQSNDYGSLVNLGVLQIQLGQLQSAKNRLLQAIEVDPLNYIAYYNLFLCNYEMKQFIKAQQDLLRSLSCLLVMKGKKHQNLRLLNRAIKYCQSNVLAYIERGKLNHLRMKNNLAGNDYSTAIQYAPEWAYIYYIRALFYRQIGKKKQCEEDIYNYLRLQEEGKCYKGIVLENKNVSILKQDSQIKENIKSKVKQFQQLLVANEFPGDNMNSPKNLMSPRSPRSPKDTLKIKQEYKQSHSRIQIDLADLEIRKSQMQEISGQMVGDDMIMGNLDTNLMDVGNDSEHLKWLKNRPKSQNFMKNQLKQQQKNNRISQEEIKSESEQEELLQDKKSSKIINIIQSQEKNQKVKYQSPKIFQPNNDDVMLSNEIEKAVQQINIKSFEKNDDLKSSISSKLSAPVEMTEEQFQTFSCFTLQIVSAQVFDKKYSKQSFIETNYMKQKKTTKNSKDLTWREKINYSLDCNTFFINITFFLKGSLWSYQEVIGKGTINLREKGQTSCMMIQNGTKKAILHYKLTLTT